MPFTVEQDGEIATLRLHQQVDIRDVAQIWTRVRGTTCGQLRIDGMECDGFDTSVAQLLVVCTRMFATVIIFPRSPSMTGSLLRCGLLPDLAPFLSENEGIQ